MTSSADGMKQMILTYKRALGQRSLVVDTLAILFGIGSWIGINSTFVQLPLLLDKAPEKWSLPSYLVVVIQLGNIGPLSYTICQRFFSKWMSDSLTILFVLMVGAISAFLIAFMHHVTALIGGYRYSVALFILVFFLALVGCSSSVLFMPYMGRFKEIYLTAYFIGEGLSGLLPSVVALIQGVGGNTECIMGNSTDGPKYESYRPPPRFNTRDYYFVIFSIALSSFVAFLLLDKMKICRKQYAAVTVVNGNNYIYESNRMETYHKDNKEELQYLSSPRYTLLCLIMAIVCFFGNGLFPAIQSYSCLPYGNRAYHLTVTLSSIANPLACFLGIFFINKSLRLILTLTSCGIVFTVYAMVTVIFSPNPPLLNSFWGETLVVISWTTLMGIVSYIKLCITIIMRSQGGKSLFWIGAISQIGSAIGSIVIFVLINYTYLFTSYEEC